MKIQLNQAYSFCQQGQRDYQEDARWPDTNMPMHSQRFFIVCDGVGGSEKGEVASKTVCRSMANSLEDIDMSKEFTPELFSEVFDAAYNALDNATEEGDKDMATTLTFVCFHAGGCTMAHVGDSRIYHYRKGEGIIYKSNDHSWVNDMVHDGSLTPEEAENHPNGNVITRYMSPVEDDEERWEATMVTTTDILPDDVFVLCSDGVTNCISDNHLIEILDSESSDSDKLKQIASESVNSSDNNTCYLVSVKAVTGNEDIEDEEPGVTTLKLKTKVYETLDVESTKRNDKQGFIYKLKRMFNL
ncbi:MAG: serine/threonine-protein phosphatase [Prevotellaceae bacterium]|nr:serine/threonine-protein phosphatase [Candidatus Minthosoma caballi]